MCGCSSQVIVERVLHSDNQGTPPASCIYTKDQAALWRDKLACVDSNNYYLQFPNYTRTNYNKFLGILNSIIIYNNNPCYYKSDLDKINDVILQLISLGLCQ